MGDVTLEMVAQLRALGWSVVPPSEEAQPPPISPEPSAPAYKPASAREMGFATSPGYPAGVLSPQDAARRRIAYIRGTDEVPGRTVADTAPVDAGDIRFFYDGKAYRRVHNRETGETTPEWNAYHEERRQEYLRWEDRNKILAGPG